MLASLNVKVFGLTAKLSPRARVIANKMLVRREKINKHS
jgi:hypothetical protein